MNGFKSGSTCSYTRPSMSRINLRWVFGSWNIGSTCSYTQLIFLPPYVATSIFPSLRGRLVKIIAHWPSHMRRARRNVEYAQGELLWKAIVTHTPCLGKARRSPHMCAKIWVKNRKWGNECVRWEVRKLGAIFRSDILLFFLRDIFYYATISMKGN